MTSLANLKKAIAAKADPKRAKTYQWFFKTGKGEYGEGDKFLGLTMPEQRQIAKEFKDLPLKEMEKALDSKFHEHRLTALVILVEQFKKATEQERQKIFKLYIKNAKKINNWDLVDSSAHKIVGWYLEDKDRKILYKLAKSTNLWERRISIISTFWFIKENDFNDSIKIAKILLRDEHDLIHKAVGWMLREIGKKDLSVLRKFLDLNATSMPRTMLRYAIEKLPEKERKLFLKKT